MNDSTHPDYDVLVIGGGGAGLAAAIQASDAGARVALLEAGERLGGSTALAGGFVYAAGTQQQQAQGIDDDPAAMVADIRTLNGDSVPPAVLERFAAEAADTLAWLGEIGVDFPVSRLVSPNGRMLPRSHEPEGFGAAIVERLDYEVSRREIDVALNTRVQGLVTDGTGRVTGVKIGDDTVTAGAVILACGGIGGAPDLVDRMCPKTVRTGDWRWHVGCETNRGDGLRMAEAVGAAITGEDSGLFLITPNFYRDLEVIGPDWVMMVNSRGQRVVREDAAYWELSEALEAQPDARGFCLFNRAAMLEAQPDPRVLEALADGTITLSWIPRVLEEQIDKGKVLAAESIAELATQMGVDATALEATVTRYNRFCQQGVDEDFDKAAASLKPMDTPPFYAAEVRPAIAIVMGSGPAIDDKARLVRAGGEPIPGAYAAGEVTGNVYGRYYVGSGYAIASALSFGRIAGREAAKFAGSEP